MYSLLFGFPSPLGNHRPLSRVPCAIQSVLISYLFYTSVASVAQSCLTLCDPMDCSTPDFPVHHQLLEFTQTHIHRVGDAIQPSHPLSSPSPPASIFHSIRIFSSESVLCIRWPKYWSFILSISPSNEYSGLISFRMDWFDLAVQGTLKSLLQHNRSKASIRQHSAFSIVQFSHSYVTTRKTIALTIWTFVSKVISLLFNMLSRFVPAFIPRNKQLLISWPQPPSAVILYIAVYLCQSQSPNLSHPSFLPWCPYMWSLYLGLYICFANRFLCTIFLDYIYMC